MLQSRAEFGPFLFIFVVTCGRKPGFPQSTTLMKACHGLPRCENNIRLAGQVAMRERRAWRLNNEGDAS